MVQWNDFLKGETKRIKSLILSFLMFDFIKNAINKILCNILKWNVMNVRKRLFNFFMTEVPINIETISLIWSANQ